MLKANMMVQRFITVLLVIALVGLVRAEDVKVVASAEELKGIKAKKITWRKDEAKIVRIPTTAGIVKKSTFNRVGDPIVVEVKAYRL